MEICKISKKNGKFRTIYMPNPEEKIVLRKILPVVNAESERADKADVQHGFRKGRNPVTNALCHVGYEYSLCFDLADFFDSVKPEMVPIRTGDATNFYPIIGKECFPDGAARQGLPTSPALANIAASKLDNEILKLQGNGRFGKLFVYTRYADDLTFSFDNKYLAKTLMEKIPQIVEACGFKINPAKTKLQWSGAGRRMITGVAVDAKGIHIPREIKRRIRAAKHQNNKKQINGLSEWAKLKLPKLVNKNSATPLRGYLTADEIEFAQNLKKQNAQTTKPAAKVEKKVIRAFNFDIDEVNAELEEYL